MRSEHPELIGLDLIAVAQPGLVVAASGRGDPIDGTEGERPCHGAPLPSLHYATDPSSEDELRANVEAALVREFDRGVEGYRIRTIAADPSAT